MASPVYLIGFALLAYLRDEEGAEFMQGLLEKAVAVQRIRHC